MEKVYRIFSNLEDILLVNRELLAQLRDRVEGDDASARDRVGDIFLNMSFALKIYSKYIGDYDTARQTLAEVEANARFAAFVEGVEERTRESLKNQKLGSLMIMPVQRIPRYELLLRELVKVKRKLGEDEWMDELESCMDAVKEVAEQNNEQIRIVESKAKLYDVQRKFSPKLCLVGPNEPTRLLVKDGDAKKVHGRGGAQVPCRLILLSDDLLYATESKSRTGALELHRKIRLADGATSFEDQADKDGLKNAIVVLNSDKSMIILCDTPAEKAQWLSALRTTREKARAKLGAAADDGVAMTLWEQDTPQCCVTKAKFTALNRRHHCRVNGECVSSDASKARFDLTALGDRFGKSERVCDWCCRDFQLCDGDWTAVVKRGKFLRESVGKIADNASALAIAGKNLEREPGQAVFASWLWKKGGAGAADGKGRAGFFGRRNWKKRWCELRKTKSGADYELLYFEDPGETTDDACKGRVSLGGAKVQVLDSTLLTFVLTAGTRDYPIRTLDHESAKDVGPTDRGYFQIWIALLEACVARAAVPEKKKPKPPPPPPKRKEEKAPVDPALLRAEWYWQHNDGSQMGPSTFDELKAAVVAGDLLGTCHIYAEEITSDWAMLDDAPRVKAALGA